MILCMIASNSLEPPKNQECGNQPGLQTTRRAPVDARSASSYQEGGNVSQGDAASGKDIEEQRDCRAARRVPQDQENVGRREGRWTASRVLRGLEDAGQQGGC